MRQEGRQFGRGQERPRSFVIGKFDGDIDMDEMATEMATEKATERVAREAINQAPAIEDDVAAGMPLIPGTEAYAEAMTEEATVKQKDDEVQKTRGSKVHERLQDSSYYDEALDARALAAEGSQDAVVQVRQALADERAVVEELQGLKGNPSKESEQRRKELFKTFVLQRKVVDEAIRFARQMVEDGSVVAEDARAIEELIDGRVAQGMQQVEQTTQRAVRQEVQQAVAQPVQPQRMQYPRANETPAQRRARQHADVSAQLRQMEDLSVHTGVGGWFKKAGIRVSRFFGRDQAYNSLKEQQAAIRAQISRQRGQ